MSGQQESEELGRESQTRRTGDSQGPTPGTPHLRSQEGVLRWACGGSGGPSLIIHPSPSCPPTSVSNLPQQQISSSLRTFAPAVLDPRLFLRTPVSN